MTADQVRSIGILAFDGMEVLDFAGPYEAFGVAAELWSGDQIEVLAIGTGAGTVTTRGGLTVVPHVSVDDADHPDVLVVPGGPGARPLLHDERLVAWIGAAARKSQTVLSVCTGALLLAAAGLLEGREATTHHDAFEELRAISPSTTVVPGERFVQSSEQVWTSAGVSAGVDLALHVLGQIVGSSVRDEVAREMEWRW